MTFLRNFLKKLEVKISTKTYSSTIVEKDFKQFLWDKKSKLDFDFFFKLFKIGNQYSLQKKKSVNASGPSKISGNFSSLNYGALMANQRKSFFRHHWIQRLFGETWRGLKHGFHNYCCTIGEIQAHIFKPFNWNIFCSFQSVSLKP